MHPVPRSRSPWAVLLWLLPWVSKPRSLTVLFIHAPGSVAVPDEGQNMPVAPSHSPRVFCAQVQLYIYNYIYVYIYIYSGEIQFNIPVLMIGILLCKVFWVDSSWELLKHLVWTWDPWNKTDATVLMELLQPWPLLPPCPASRLPWRLPESWNSGASAVDAVAIAACVYKCYMSVYNLHNVCNVMRCDVRWCNVMECNVM